MTEPMTPAQRSMRSSAAAYTRWSQVDDRKAATRPALHGFLARFEREVDPDNELDPEVRATRADAAMRAYMKKLALKSSRTRVAKRPARRAQRGAT